MNEIVVAGQAGGLRQELAVYLRGLGVAVTTPEVPEVGAVEDPVRAQELVVAHQLAETEARRRGATTLYLDGPGGVLAASRGPARAGLEILRPAVIDSYRAVLLDPEHPSLEFWLSHPKLQVVDSFSAAIPALRQALGLDPSIEDERKFLLPRAPAGIPEPWVRVEIDQHYLEAAGDQELRLRSWRHGAAETRLLTEKRPIDTQRRYEQEQRIDPHRYRRLLAASRAAITKERWRFVYRRVLFELDHFPDLDLWILEVENPPSGLELPFDVGAEVTGQRRFSTAYLAENGV